MNSADIVAYTHPDGYQICPGCYEGATKKEQKEFSATTYDANESDWPGSSCDWCHEHLDGSLILSSDNFRYERVKTLPDKIASELGITKTEDTPHLVFKYGNNGEDSESSDYMGQIIDIITDNETIDEVGDFQVASDDGNVYIVIWPGGIPERREMPRRQIMKKCKEMLF